MGVSQLSPTCLFTFLLKAHIIKKHEDSAIITTVTTQQLLLCEAMELFKHDIAGMLNALLNGQNYIKNELQLVKEDLVKEKNYTEKKEVLIETDDNEQFKAHKSKVDKGNQAKEKHEKNHKESYASKASQQPKAATQKPEKIKDEPYVPTKILFVGDSHANNLDGRVFENQTNT